ncbi:hypothetical protein A9G24_05540 [Gilliamella sp. App6-5]|uniref:protein rep n=1 Tax=Gilliamella sp. App6-5 TaxID=3120232 RepID=UPI00080EB1A2|nr:protein rep [Gilliamella apicola]OCG15224.1 hypothetical protein A9G24_05540 [Gilliamella apicola]
MLYYFRGYLHKQIADPKTGEVNIKLKKTFFCRVRHCPVCQWRKSLFWKARFYKALPSIMEQYKSGRWLFLTLTVKNCNVEQLNETIGKMNNAFRKMCKRKHFLKYNLGFVKTIEVTRNTKDNTAHPHFHTLLLQKSTYFKSKKSYMTQYEWAELWRDCLGINDYLPIVDIRAVKKTKSSEDLVDAVAETLKYAVKPSDMIADRDWFLEMTNQLFKSRLLSTGGVLKNSFKEDVSEEEMLLEDEQEDQEGDNLNLITFNWYKSLFKYRRKLNDDVENKDDSKAYLKHKHKTINAIKQRIQNKQDEREERDKIIKHIAEIEALVKAKMKEEIDKIDVPTVTI